MRPYDTNSRPAHEAARGPILSGNVLGAVDYGVCDVVDGIAPGQHRLASRRVTGDEQYRDALEADLEYRIWLRRGLIVALFVAAGALGVSAFFTVAGSDP